MKVSVKSTKGVFQKTGIVTIGPKGKVSIRRLVSSGTWNIRIYARYSADYIPNTRRIRYSIDGTNYTTSNTLAFSTADNPDYDLVVNYNNVSYSDVWIVPDNSLDVLLNSDIISADSADPGDYPYNKDSNPYQYSVHNGSSISSQIDLYFQIAFFL